MLQAVADMWWRRIHRHIVLLAQSCSQCQQAGKILKTTQKQAEYGKLPAAELYNDELAIDFVSPFKIAPPNKKNLFVSIDRKLAKPNAPKKADSKKSCNFLNAHIGQFGIPKRIRTDPATIFRSKTFKEFCKEHYIEHIGCPVRNHRGNSKIERLIRTINELLRAEKVIITEKENSGKPRLSFLLRTAVAAKKISPFRSPLGDNHCLRHV